MTNNQKNRSLRSLEMQMLVDELLADIPIIIDQQKALAKIHKIRFESLLEEGFTESQALEIVAKRPIAE